MGEFEDYLELDCKDLNITVVRPGILTNEPATGEKDGKERREGNRKEEEEKRKNKRVGLVWGECLCEIFQSCDRLRDKKWRMILKTQSAEHATHIRGGRQGFNLSAGNLVKQSKLVVIGAL